MRDLMILSEQISSRFPPRVCWQDNSDLLLWVWFENTSKGLCESLLGSYRGTGCKIQNAQHFRTFAPTDMYLQIADGYKRRW